MTSAAIVGRIVREAQITTEGDVVLAKTTIASDRSRGKNAKTDFLDVVAFGDQAGQLASLAPAEFVRITGTIRTGSYTDSNGTRRKSATIAVRKIERYREEAA